MPRSINTMISTTGTPSSQRMSGYIVYLLSDLRRYGCGMEWRSSTANQLNRRMLSNTLPGQDFCGADVIHIGEKSNARANIVKPSNVGKSPCYHL